MNKITYAFALGAGLVLSLTGPSAQAAAITNSDTVQTLTPTQMSASMFNSLFTPSTAVLTEPYAFMNTPNAGVVESQVFTGDANSTQGLYAYAYQIGVNKVNDTSINQPTSVNSASTLFNATPVGTNLTGAGTTYAYVITNGQVGGINVPQAAPNSTVQTPSSIAWLPSSSTGSLTFQYLNPTTHTGPLGAGALSGTVVVISTQPFTQQYVSLQNPEPQTVYPKAYSPTPGSINQIPAPEPATFLAWTGVIAGLALGERFRRTRQKGA
jgi:hypothetical protein